MAISKGRMDRFCDDSGLEVKTEDGKWVKLSEHTKKAQTKTPSKKTSSKSKPTTKKKK